MIQELSLPLVAWLISALLIGLLSPVARKTGWSDHPDERKQHSGSTPLVGGVAILLAILATLLWAGFPVLHMPLLWIMVPLCLVGLLDDVHPLPAKPRLLLQASVLVAVCWLADFRITHLGNMFGFGEVVLPDWLGLVVAVFAMLAMVNAINMIDGVDGMAGGVLIAALLWLSVLVVYAGGSARVPLVVAGAVAGYLCFNMRGPLRKKAAVFMGDAGSTMLGASVTWMLVCHSQPTDALGYVQAMPLAVVPWLIVVPLMDSTALIFSRGLQGDSPFKADRRHLHHLLQQAGFNDRQVAILVVAMAMIGGGIGVGGWLLGVPEPVLSWGFVLLFVWYYYAVHHTPSAAKWFRRVFLQPGKQIKP